MENKVLSTECNDALKHSNYKAQIKTCKACRNHGFVVPYKNHKLVCPYENCMCLKCQILKNHRKRCRVQSPTDNDSSSYQEFVELKKKFYTQQSVSSNKNDLAIQNISEHVCIQCQSKITINNLDQESHLDKTLDKIENIIEADVSGKNENNILCNEKFDGNQLYKTLNGMSELIKIIFHTVTSVPVQIDQNFSTSYQQLKDMQQPSHCYVQDSTIVKDYQNETELLEENEERNVTYINNYNQLPDHFN